MLNSKWKILSLSAILGGFCVVACSGGEEASPSVASQASEARTRLDGETIFAGYFLGVGPVAKRFPELWEDGARRGAQNQDQGLIVEVLSKLADDASLSPETTEHLKQTAEQIRSGKFKLADDEPTPQEALRRAKSLMEGIRAKNPDFFTKFASLVQSGRPQLVDKALSAGARALLESVFEDKNLERLKDYLQRRPWRTCCLEPFTTIDIEFDRQLQVKLVLDRLTNAELGGGIILGR